MVTCSAIGCVNRSDRHHSPGVTFHKFPTDPARRDLWVKAVQRGEWQPATRSVLCSAHFKEEDFDRTSLCTVRLKAGAVPCIFPDPSARRRKLPKTKKSRSRVQSPLLNIPVNGINSILKKKENWDQGRNFKFTSASKRWRCDDVPSIVSGVLDSSLTIMKIPNERSAENPKALLPHEFLEIQLGNSDKVKHLTNRSFSNPVPDPSLSISKVPKKRRNFEFKKRDFSFREIIDTAVAEELTVENKSDIIPEQYIGMLDPALIIQKVPRNRQRKSDGIFKRDELLEKPGGMIPPDFLEIQLTVVEDPPLKEIACIPLLDSNEISIQRISRSSLTIEPVLTSANGKSKADVNLTTITEPKMELVEHSNKNVIK